MRRLACLALASALLAASVAAQQTPPPEGQPQPGEQPTPGEKPPEKPGEKPPAVVEPKPEEYSPDEFAPWQRELRRGEIIAVGAFPLLYIFTQLGYNLYRYSVNGFAPEYSPVGNPNRVPYTESETMGVLLGAASASVLVAAADWAIGRVRTRRAERGGPRAQP